MIVRSVVWRLRDTAGQIVGNAIVHKRLVGMSVLARMTSLGDQRHFDRLERVAKPGPQAAAILFGDLESSSALSRWLATANFFALIRRLARVADHEIVDEVGQA